jgi:hypothetical protein
MSTTFVQSPVMRPRPARRRTPLLRVLAPVVAVAAAVGLLGVRLATRPGTTITSHVAPGHFVPVPSNPAIEAAWGLRITYVLLEADRGMVDVRYQVVDPAKSGRIHGSKTSTVDPKAQLASLPALVLESSGQKITGTSAMMHFEHFHFQTELLGTTYSILYGNSGGLLHLGDKITIQMADGLKLEHVVIAS